MCTYSVGLTTFFIFCRKSYNCFVAILILDIKLSFWKKKSFLRSEDHDVKLRLKISSKWKFFFIEIKNVAKSVYFHKKDNRGFIDSEFVIRVTCKSKNIRKLITYLHFCQKRNNFWKLTYFDFKTCSVKLETMIRNRGHGQRRLVPRGNRQHVWPQGSLGRYPGLCGPHHNTAGWNVMTGIRTSLGWRASLWARRTWRAFC